MEKVSKTRMLAGTAVFAALCYAVSWLEFAIFPEAGFLKMDFSNVFVMLGGFMYGPISGVAITAVKEFLCFLTKSSTGGVGEIANFLLTCSYMLLPAIAYKFKKGIGPVIIYLLCACALQTAAALVVNKYINFPLYAGGAAAQMFASLWQFVLYFNLIKSAAISLITLLLYKRISWIFNKIRFTKTAQ